MQRIKGLVGSISVGKSHVRDSQRDSTTDSDNGADADDRSKVAGNDTITSD